MRPWRFTTFNVPGEKTFNANVGMYYGWQDIRGYDSIIPRQYAQLMNRIQPQDNELLYNRIAPLYAEQGGDVYAVLDNPLLDLLNVKYVLTEHAHPESVVAGDLPRRQHRRLREPARCMPRVMLVPEAQVAPAEQQPLTETRPARGALHRGDAGGRQRAWSRPARRWPRRASAATRPTRSLST